MNHRILHRLLAGLIVATVFLLVWNHYGMDSVLEIGAASPYTIKAIDDRASGGKSEARLSRRDGKLVLDCEIRAGYEWPYCETSIQLRPVPLGVDLSQYDSVRLWVHAQGPEPKQQVRVAIKNFNPAYSKLGQDLSLKVHEVVFQPDAQPQPLDVKLSQFTVASWWNQENPIPIQFAGTEFDNVSVVEVTTGGVVKPGVYRITVERIEFRGKLIRAATLLWVLIAVWMLSVVACLVADVVVTRRRLRASTRNQSSLRRINESLRVQSQAYAKLAGLDPLTGILNRNGLGEELSRVAQSGDQHLFPLSLIFIDIDHFKQINDQHGHGVGDQVIKGLAEITRVHIQRQDLFARWGGEEFLLVCPLTHSHEAQRIAERLRQVIAERAWPAGIRVTSSFGVTQAVAGEDLSECIRRADEAMYRAKQMGRDRVEVQLSGFESEDLAA